jgi:sensor domain CHASE-containing protein
MDLRTKTLLIFGVSLVAIFSGFVIYSSFVLEGGISGIENREVQADVMRAELAVNMQISDLNSRLKDWASWDDTYYFATGTNPGYQEENLQADTFRTLDLDYILIYNTSGDLVYGMHYDGNTRDTGPLPEEFLATVASDVPLFTFHQPETDPPVSGVLFVDKNPIAVTVQPLLKSNGTGPSTGIMIMGRDLDRNRLDRISRSTGVLVSLHDPSSPASDLVLNRFSGAPQQGRQIVISPLNRNTIRGYIPMSELNVTPSVYVMEISEPRTIYQSGMSTLYTFLLIFFIMVTVFGILALLVIDRLVLSRISMITHDIRKIGSGEDNERIAVVPGDDELAHLSVAINQMLEQLSQIKRRYQNIVEDQSEWIVRFTPDGTLTFMNPSFRKEIIDLTGDREPVSIFHVLHPAGTGTSCSEVLESVSPETPLASGEMELSFAKEDRTIACSVRGIYDSEGTLQEYQFVGRDVTPRKQADAALNQVTKKLAMLNFITFNEIKNAVFTLRGFLTLGKTATDSANLPGYLGKAEESVRKIESTLDFAKQYQDLGARPPQWQDVNQSFLIGISHLDYSSVRRSVRLDNLEIYAEPLLERVFLTLGANVLRHAGDATEISLDYRLTGNGLLISFRDNGTGVPDSEKENIFTRGYGKQKGMQLFLVREILGITGITIRETGTYGSGACFEITVPRMSYRLGDESHDRPPE